MFLTIKSSSSGTDDNPMFGMVRAYWDYSTTTIAGLSPYMYSSAAKAAGTVATGFAGFSFFAEATNDITANNAWGTRSGALLLTAGKFGVSYGTGVGVGLLNLQPITGIPVGIGAGILTGKLYDKFILNPIQSKFGINPPYEYLFYALQNK